jgi:hypothetical protein
MNPCLSCFVLGLEVKILFHRSSIPSCRRFNGQGSHYYVRANITINDAGIMLAASNAPPPPTSTAVSRVNQKMSIALSSKRTLPALLSLIHALRAVKTTSRLYHSNENESTQFTQSKICIRLAQMALSILECQHLAGTSRVANNLIFNR